MENCTRFQQKNNYVKFPFIDNVTWTIAKYLNEYFEEKFENLKKENIYYI